VQFDHKMVLVSKTSVLSLLHALAFIASLIAVVRNRTTLMHRCTRRQRC